MPFFKIGVPNWARPGHEQPDVTSDGTAAHEHEQPVAQHGPAKTKSPRNSTAIEAILEEKKAIHVDIDRASRLGHLANGLVFRLLGCHCRLLDQDRGEADRVVHLVDATIRQLRCMFPVAQPPEPPAPPTPRARHFGHVSDDIRREQRGAAHH